MLNYINNKNHIDRCNVYDLMDNIIADNEKAPYLGMFRENALDSVTKLVVNPNDVDSVVMSILNKFIQRSKFGRAKYGTDLDREDLSVLDWIAHAQEEHMDAILYLEKLKKTLVTDSTSIHIDDKTI